MTETRNVCRNRKRERERERDRQREREGEKCRCPALETEEEYLFYVKCSSERTFPANDFCDVMEIIFEPPFRRRRRKRRSSFRRLCSSVTDSVLLYVTERKELFFSAVLPSWSDYSNK
jgi:hypothetical protein